MLAHSFGWGSILALNIFLPMYLQTVLGWSATSSGLSLMILMVTLNASAGLSSQLVGRVKHYKLLPMMFLFVGIGAVVALALSAATMTTLQFEIILFLIGVGFGPTAPLTQVVLQNTVSIHHLGAAIGTMNFVRTLMSTILVAVFGAIVLAAVPIGTAGDTLGQRALAGTSVSTFVMVFFAAAITRLAGLPCARPQMTAATVCRYSRRQSRSAGERCAAVGRSGLNVHGRRSQRAWR